MDDEGLDPRRARAGARRRARAGVPLHDPDLPEPERAHAQRPSGAGDSSSSRVSTTCSCSRTIRTGSSVTRATAPPTLFELEGGERVVYSSSFSKTIAPGLRVGYFVLPEALDARARGAGGVDVHHPRAARPGDGVRVPAPRKLRAEPRARARHCSARAATRCSRRSSRSFRTRTLEPAGGRLLHLARAARRRTRRVARRAGEAGVTFVPGTDFGGAPNTARLAFSFVSPDEIREGVRRLAALVREPLPV